MCSDGCSGALEMQDREITDLISLKFEGLENARLKIDRGRR